MRFIIIVIFIISTFSGFSQEYKFKLKEVIHKDGYDYVPLEYMKDSLDGLVGFRYFDDENGEKNSKAIEIYWNSSCIDGSFHLVITPEQIYLRSGHNNPNPNRFYWVLPIDKLVYKSIENTFKEKKSFQLYDEKYNDDFLIKLVGKVKFDEKCEEKLKKQILKYFKIFNDDLMDYKLDYSKIIYPLNPLLYNHLSHPFKKER